METVDSLPKQAGIIGLREIVKGINSGKVKSVIIAKNCPEVLSGKIVGLLNTSQIVSSEEHGKLPKSAEVKVFSGNQKELGTKLGKPFPVSAVGYS